MVRMQYIPSDEIRRLRCIVTQQEEFMEGIKMVKDEPEGSAVGDADLQEHRKVTTSSIRSLYGDFMSLENPDRKKD